MRMLVTLALRYLAGRKLRTTLTTLAIVFGVAVIFAVNLGMPTLVTTLESSMLGVSGQVDLAVSSAIGETFGTDVLDRVKNTPGIAAASPALRRQMSLTAASGVAIPMEMIGIDPTTATTVRRYAVLAGRFLNREDAQAAVLSESLAARLGTRPGDQLSLPTPRGLATLTAIGIVAAPEGDQVMVPLATAQELFAAPGRINTVEIALAAGAERAAVQSTLEKALGESYRVGSIASQIETFGTMQAGLVGMNIVGLLTLFMGGFLIFNTFRTSVVERRHDIGMLRAVGATRRTIVALILIESALQGVIGTLAGLILGYLFALAAIVAMQGMFEEFLRVRVTGVVVKPEALALAIGLGIGVALVGGLLPALGASRVPVMAALKPQSKPPAARRVGKGTIAGGVLLLLALAGLLSQNASLAGVGALLFLAGLVLLAPALVEPLARLFRPLLQLAFAREGVIAEGNLQRHPGRAAITASAIMIGLAIIVAASSLFSSIEDTFFGLLDRSVAADAILLPPSILWSNNVGTGPEFAAQLAQIEGIEAWASLRYAGATAAGVSVQVLAIDPLAYPRIAALSFDQGDESAYQALADERAVIVTPVLASAEGLRVGDSLPVETAEGTKAYRIVGVGSEYLTAKVNSLYISQQNLAADFHRSEDVLVLANLAPGADREAVKGAIGQLLQRYPQFTLRWGADWRAEQRTLMEQAFLGLDLVLIVLILPSLLGLINTLAINVLERTREIGVLRAVGATRQQVRRLVLAESLLLGAAGAAFGMLAGLALGYGLTAMLAAVMTSLLHYHFPLAGLVAAVAAALLMAIVASILPARQAARLPIVKALQYE